YSINNTNIFTINIQFTESVSNFDQADLSISNATIDNFTVIDGLNYEFELLPNGAGDISLDVAASLAQDNVGNQNTAASTVIVLFDNTAPVIPTVNTLITNNVVPIISGTNGLSAAQPIDETITLQINGATYSVIPDASGDWIIDLQNDVPSAGSLGALSDGNTYEVLVTITDFAGNVSADTSANELTIDTTAPQIPTITNQSTNDQSPSLAGTAEPSSQITLTLNSVNFETTANLSGNWSINTETAISTAGGPFTTLTDGTYEVLVKSTDAAGNFTLDTSSDELIIDASFPTSATVDILITNNQTPILTGNNGLGTTQPADEVVKVTVNGATYTVIPDASGNWSIATQTDAPSSGTLTIFTEGAYEVSVEVTDLGGNVSTDISSDELTIDLTAPAIPTINSLVTNNTTPTISGSAEANSLISLILNGVTFETTATIAGNWSIDTDNDTPTSGGPFTTLNEGVFDIVVTATDVAGNSSNDSTTDELNVDTTAPNIPTVDALISKLTKPIVTGTNGSTIVLPADEDLSVAINGSTFSVITDASGNWAVDLSSDLPMSGTFSDLGDGFYELSATIQDQAGNSSNDLSSNELLIDTSAPSVPTVNSANTNNQKPMLSGTAEIGSNLSLVINGVTFEPMVLGDGSWSIDLATASAVSGGPLADLAEGLYEILLTSTDQAGNTSNDSSTDEILIDTTAPATPTINQLTTNSDFPLISGTAEAGTNLVLIINAVTYSLVVPIDGAWSLNTQPATADAGGPFNALTDGLYDVVLNSTDQAGNSSVDTTIDELLIDTVSPVIPIINQLETDNTLPIITGTAEANSTIRLSLDGLIFETITLGDGTWSVNTGVDTPLAGGPFVSLSDGVYDIAVSSYDAAGNENTDNSIDELTITTVTLGIPTVNVLESTDGLPTLTGTWDQTNADELNVSFASQSFVLGVDAELTNVGNLWTLDLTNLTQPLANGVYDVVVYTSNASKNTIDATVDELTVNIVLVIAIPTVNELLSANGLPLLWGTWDEVNTSILVITVANVSYSLSANAELTTDGSGSWSLDLSSLATPLEMGVYDVEVFSSDTQGNSAVDNTTDELTVTIPELGIPTVNEVESSDGLPIITGTWDHLNALTLLVRVNSVSYNLAANTELSAQNENWTLDLSQFSSAMLNGSYEVEVNTANNTETTVDATINELFVNNPLQDLDQDNVFDIDEDLNTNGNFDDDDTDGDNIPNYLDTDDDNDQVPTIEEDYDNDGNPQNEDTDGDIIPDYLDFDDDGDGLTTLEEDVDQNGDPRNDDTDGDSIPDYLDPINDVTSKADLAISMVVSVGPYLLDQSVTYTVIVTNIGPDIATDVLVTDRLATSFGFSSAETSRGIYNELNGSWPLGELAVGRTDTLSLSLQLVEKGLIENTASVEGNELDENVENNEVLISIEVDENFEVGKGFSPNGDGINDTWKIAGIDLFLNNTVKVFNRWGNEVFSTKGYDNNSNNWDGTNQGSLSSANGRVPEGTYFYVIELEAGLSKMTGYLTIKN
ncbi:MAG: gliding motility-associated-like protein, partial [Marivirga sp.]